MTGTPPLFPQVVVYGTICLDRFVAVEARGGEDRLPAKAGAAVRERAGGEAFNTATALAGWQVPVALTGTAIGDDPEGRRLWALLDEDDDPASAPYLSRRLVARVPAAVTPTCLIRVTPDGERFMNGKGFDRALAPPLAPLRAVLRHRPVFAVDPNLGNPAIKAALAAAQAGCPVVAMDFAGVPEVVRVCRILVTSVEALARHKQADSLSVPELEDAAASLRAQGAPLVIITRGAGGCLVSASKKEEEEAQARIVNYPAVTVADVVDTTGAGDTFRAGLCYGLLQNWPTDRMIRFASAAAALHCTVWGGGSRIPLEIVLRAAWPEITS